MPLIHLHTSASPSASDQESLLLELSEALAHGLHKPETYVMCTLSFGPLCMGGELGPGAFVDLRSVGRIDPETNRALSARLCALLAKRLGCASDRIYLNFTDVPGSHWGWDGSTFG